MTLQGRKPSDRSLRRRYRPQLFALCFPPIAFISSCFPSLAFGKSTTDLAETQVAQVASGDKPSATQERREKPLRVLVREIRITGGTVFSPEELARVAQPYVNRTLETGDLLDLRRTLTDLYTRHGYVNSGAFLPDQDLTDGVLEIYLIEGILSEIDVAGTRWFRPEYLKNRIALGATVPLNTTALQERLQFLLQDARILRLSSELKPGLKIGEAVLEVQVEEARPYQFLVEFNNYQNPSVGAERGLGTLIHRNLLGWGDVFRFTYGRSEGVNPLLEASYAIPLTAHDTTLSLEYRRNQSEVVESPFDELNIETERDAYRVTLRHPFYRTLGQEFALSLTGEYQSAATTVGGQSFSLAPGSRNGKADVAVIRFAQDWLDRSPKQVIALRSRFSIGLDALDSTTNEDNELPSSEFFAWLGQAQWARRVGARGLQIVSRLDLQLSDDRLFPVEQFPVGGRFTVRGYRENTLVRDNALVASLEVRHPILTKYLASRKTSLSLAAFVDAGRAWQNSISTPRPKTLASIGIGFRASLFGRAELDFYWGYQLDDVPSGDDTLQDNGIHIGLVVQALR